MSGTWPADPKARDVEFGSFSPTLVSVAHSLKRQTRQHGGHSWHFKLKFPAMLRADLAPIMAFMAKQAGRYESFEYSDPYHLTPQGIATGTPLVNGADQVGSTIITDGWTASQTGIMKAGDFILFAGHTKVYMVTADANSDAGGAATLSIFPDLIASPANNAAITISAVPFTVAFLTDVSAINVTLAGIYGLSVDLVEVY